MDKLKFGDYDDNTFPSCEDILDLKAGGIEHLTFNGAVDTGCFIYNTCNSENKFEFIVNGKIVGTLYIEDPIRFDGNAEESAKIFFNEVIKVIIWNRE